MKIVVNSAGVTFHKDSIIEFNQKKFDAQQNQLVDKFIKDCTEQDRLREELAEQNITDFMKNVI